MPGPSTENATNQAALPLFVSQSATHTARARKREREERQQEDVTERWWATNPKENIYSCVFFGAL